MRTLQMLLKYSLAGIVVTTVSGGIGMLIGGTVLLNIPPPKSPLCGNDYLAGGALIGGLLGLAAVIALAIQEIKRKRQISTQSEQAS